MRNQKYYQSCRESFCIRFESVDVVAVEVRESGAECNAELIWGHLRLFITQNPSSCRVQIVLECRTNFQTGTFFATYQSIHPFAVASSSNTVSELLWDS